MVQFAHDTNTLVTDKNMEELQDKIDRGMKQLEGWFFNNDLIINTEKTRMMLFHCNKLSFVEGPRIVFNKLTN
jgi:hypothetical protein